MSNMIICLWFSYDVVGKATGRQSEVGHLITFLMVYLPDFQWLWMHQISIKKSWKIVYTSLIDWCLKVILWPGDHLAWPFDSTTIMFLFAFGHVFSNVALEIRLVQSHLHAMRKAGHHHTCCRTGNNLVTQSYFWYSTLQDRRNWASQSM